MKPVFLIILLHFTLSGFAQKAPPKRLHLNHLFMEDGLPEGHINKFLQDKEGYMWFGTFDGIVRFDGYTAKTYELPSGDSRISPVLDICEDSSGNLWVADYYHGLYQYDRFHNRFIHYTHNEKNRNSMAAGELRSVTADDKGNIWLAILNTKENKVTIDRCQSSSKTFTHYTFTDKNNFLIASLYQSPVTKDEYGNIWCGSQNGVQKFNFEKNRFEFYLSNNDTLKQKTIEIICADPVDKNIVWLSNRATATGSFEGVLKMNVTTGEVTSYRHRDNGHSIASDTVLNIQADSEKRIWICTTKGLSLFNPSTNGFVSYCPGKANANPSAGHITKFAEDKDGDLWFAPASGIDPNINANLGLFVFNPATKQFNNYKVDALQSDGLISNTIRNLYIDPSGCLWMNASAAGAQWMSSRGARFVVHASDEAKHSFYPTDFFNSCAEAKDGTLWMATTGGLYHWFPDTDSLVLIVPDKKSGNSPLLSIFIDDNGMIWYSGDDASKLQGLFCYDPATGKLQHYRASGNTALPSASDFIHHIIQSYTGKLLLCTDTGLYTFDKNKKAFSLYRYDAGGNSALRRTRHYTDLVWTAYEDREHQLWLGTLGSLTSLDISTGKFTYYQNKLPHFQWIQNYYEDRKNRLWASSYNGGGLLMLDRHTNTIKRLSEKDGLLFNGPGCMLEDDSGNIWVKSVRGISIINPVTFAIRNLTDDVFTEPNHLINYSFRTSRGLFIFPSKYGFVTLHPSDFTPDYTTPVVHIESVSFSEPQTKQKPHDSVMVAYSKPSLSLHYNENRITFSYVGILYEAAPAIRYKYRLDGYDNNWINAGSQRAVTYNNLAPGTYVFHVNAANSDGIWSTKEDTVTIIIAPPFWETWWFRLLLSILIFTIAFFVLRYYLRSRLQAQQREFEKVQAIEKVRSKISMDIHDEIGSGLTKISLLSERIESKWKHKKEIDPDVIKKIAASSKEVVFNLGEIIWAINPKHDNLPSLLAYIRNYMYRFFEQTTIRVHIDFPDEIDSVTVSPDIKHNVFLVIKESLNNIIKHAGASEVDIHFEYNNQSYRFRIKDNGKGMDESGSKAFGNGLRNMNNRMAAINGTVAFQSEKDRGTVVLIEGSFHDKL